MPIGAPRSFGAHLKALREAALKTLEDAWGGMLRTWAAERTKESLEKALPLAARAEQLFPDSLHIQEEVERVRAYAREDGILKP